jgi:NAD(P)-dependent dehydrogenase (short-subunit alcohol dehydrogenase family)
MRRVLVVGGSRGIGKAIVASQLASGNRVINISRSKPEIFHDHLDNFYCDVLKEELPVFEKPIDSIVYCPGSINLKPFKSLKLEDFQEDLSLNFMGAVKVIQFYFDQLKAGTLPSVLLFSTVAVKLGMPYHSSIASAKGAIEGLVKSLGAEWAPTIRINAIAPSLVNTDLSAKLLRNESMIEKMVERHPMKRILNPEEIAAFALYLLSGNAQSISGQIFEMDNGIVSFKI